jgi:hypothetical protein
MSDIPEQIQNILGEDPITWEEAARQLYEVIEKSKDAVDWEAAGRQLYQLKLTYSGLGYALGAVTGAFIAWKVAYRKSELRYSKLADEEVAEMSEHYHAKVRAMEASQKGSLDDLVAERGYDTDAVDEKPPMAISPPAEIVDAAAESTSEEATRIPPPVPADPAPKVKVSNIFRDSPREAAIMDSWDYEAEKRRRSPDIPYVIHYDERTEFEDYDEMTLTYFEKDNVLCNERDEVIAEGEERDSLIGEGNLDRFGHGSNDPSVVYIRNDRLEMVIEVCLSHQAYATEVHGFEHTGYSGNLERMRQRERDEQDDD